MMSSELIKSKNINLANGPRRAERVDRFVGLNGVNVGLPTTESAVQPATQYGFRRVCILPTNARPTEKHCTTTIHFGACCHANSN